MRESIILLVLILGIFTLYGNESYVYKFWDNEIIESSNEHNEEKIGESTKYITHESNPLLKLAQEGKIDGLEFGIGSSSDEIIAAWGMPNRYDYFMGGVYLAYEEQEVTFFTNAYINNDEIENGEVVWIGLSGEDREIYGIRLGMTFEDIETVLGEPSYKENPYEQVEDNELYGGNWLLPTILEVMILSL